MNIRLLLPLRIFILGVMVDKALGGVIVIGVLFVASMSSSQLESAAMRGFLQ